MEDPVSVRAVHRDSLYVDLGTISGASDYGFNGGLEGNCGGVELREVELR